MQGKSLYAILLSIIAVLALALAVLVIFLLTTYNNLKAPTSAASPTPAQAREVPTSEQGQYDLYASSDGSGSDAVFNLKPSTAHENSFLAASITIVYDEGAKNKFAEERSALLEKSKSELKQACIEYFLSLTYEDLTSDSAAMQKARDALKDNFTSILAKETKDSVIVKIVIDKWNIQP